MDGGTVMALATPTVKTCYTQAGPEWWGRAGPCCQLLGSKSWLSTCLAVALDTSLALGGPPFPSL